jgi:hypothetical protein
MGRALRFGVVAGGVAFGLAVVVACGSRRDGFDSSAFPDGGAPIGEGGSGFGELPDANDPRLPPGETRDPDTCEEAKTSKSYVGCDYWPTVTPNVVWNIFDYAVVVANTGTKEAEIKVTGPNAVNKSVTVPPGELKKIYLPWVPALKGPENNCGQSSSLEASVIESQGAYHLVSSSPVIVYQFNAIQYKGEGEGGEDADGGAKDWSKCPASACGGGLECFSYSNDASLLLPSTAMTNNYRAVGFKGVAPGLLGGGVAVVLSVTATQDNTQVITTMSSTAAVMASGSSGQQVTATGPNKKLTIVLAKAGDVLEMVAEKGKDFSGSLVQSDKPVQVIASVPCINIPQTAGACDHIEETVPPAETLGVHYVVPTPTGPKGKPVQHDVRFYGNKDGTRLSYAPKKPPGCPDTLNAGQVVDCGLVGDAFDVSGTAEFAVAVYLLGASQYQGGIFDPSARGDPSQSTVASVEQFRTKYVFLAPKDYPVLYADITATEDAEIDLDGKRISQTWTSVGSPFGVFRVDLTKTGKDGAHTLTAKKPVGVQVIGFGDNTSFQYPAGLNLNLIAPPPAPPN